MKISLGKKRTKSSRARGSHTHGRGFMKKGRGSGHRGGFGMAGTGKRADQKKSLIIAKGIDYFGKRGLKPKPEKYKIINLSEIERVAGDKKEVELKKYKILGNGEINKPITIHAFAASKKAIEKIEKIGGKIILNNGNKKSTEESS